MPKRVGEGVGMFDRAGPGQRFPSPDHRLVRIAEQA